MEIDYRLIVALVLLAILIGFGYVCGGVEQENSAFEESGEIVDEIGEEGQSNIFRQVEGIVRAAPTGPSRPEKKDPYIGEPRNVSTDGAFSLRTYVETERETDAVENAPEEGDGDDFYDELDGLVPTDNKGGHESSAGARNDDQIQRRLEVERAKTDSFLRDLANWGNINVSAYNARIKAQSIREQAEQIRSDALDEQPIIRSEMLRRATIMDSYANRLSSTRGNSYKMRRLLYDANQELSEEP